MKTAAVRKVAIAAGAAAMTIILCGAVDVEGASYRHEEAITKTITVEGAKRLVIESLSGDITVTGEEGRETIELKLIKVVRADDEKTARKIAESMGVVITRPEEILKIETR